MRYRLRTLLILLAIGPPLVAVGYLKWLRNLEVSAIRMMQQQEFEKEQKRAAARHAKYLTWVESVRKKARLIVNDNPLPVNSGSTDNRP
jgi:hypothetical protein